MNTLRFVLLAVCVIGVAIWQELRLNQIHADVLRLTETQRVILSAQKLIGDRLKGPDDAMAGVTGGYSALVTELRAAEEAAVLRHSEVQSEIAEIKSNIADLPGSADWEQFGTELEEIKESLNLIIDRIGIP